MEVCGRIVNIQGRLVRIARVQGDKYKFLDAPESIIDGVKRSGKRVDIFTFIQKLGESPKYSYPMMWDNFAALPVTTFDHWWNEQIGFKARNKASQARKKGVVVREVPFDDTLVKGIWEVYNECPVRQGGPFLHYGKNIDTIRREHSTYLESSVFIGAFLGEKMIGFAKLTSDDSLTQAGLMNIVSMVGHRDKAPTNALIAQAVRSCADRGIRYLVYSNFAYGKKLRSSLSDFKERNGFQKIDVPRYYVPLTRVGRIALALGLHKGVVQFLPEPVLIRLRDLRSSWYNRKFQPAMRG